MARIDRGPVVQRIYEVALRAGGPRRWWPCDPTGVRGGADEIIIGAVLTQNTAWLNVEKALAALKAEGLCDLAALARRTPESIAPLIRSAGYFNLKAKRLRSVAEFFAPVGRARFGELAAMDDDALRHALLGVYGVGRETADSILLYALGRRTFVIDAYTLRIGARHGLFPEGTGYEAARELFNRYTPDAIDMYNEYHALLVWIGNRFCAPKPRCAGCPLARRDCCATAADWRAIERRAAKA